MAQEVFAFGDNSIDDKACPAVAARRGPIEGNKTLTIAEQYDEEVRLRYSLDEGTIPASVAESCWNQAIRELLSDAQYYEVLKNDPEHADYLREAADVGKEIRDSVFGE